MQHVYIIGSKGIPARYGGYETFVDKLTAGQVSRNIKYHVAARSDNSEFGSKKRFEYNNAEVFNISVPNIGPAQAIYYDLAALSFAIKDAKRIHAKNPIFYILACRIGPFIRNYVKRIHQLHGTYFVNPDGHEWKRAKWSKPVRRYWKISEKLMIKYSDLVVCDNKKIEEYIQKQYGRFTPKTVFIAYGTDTTPSFLTSENSKVREWFELHHLQEGNYYLVVGRFVPENNFETMIREFLNATSKRQLVVITNVKKNKFYGSLLKKTNFDQDARINFVGTVYDQPLLRYIRVNAYGYLHGHEVGGTNPSLLEALSTTPLNLLIDVGFNKSVAGNAALYWSKKSGSLASAINKAESLSSTNVDKHRDDARSIIAREYTWPIIVHKYERLFNKSYMSEDKPS